MRPSSFVMVISPSTSARVSPRLLITSRTSSPLLCSARAWSTSLLWMSSCSSSMEPRTSPSSEPTPSSVFPLPSARLVLLRRMSLSTSPSCPSPISQPLLYLNSSRHIAELAGRNTDHFVLPVPALNVINGGSHAGNKLAMQVRIGKTPPIDNCYRLICLIFL